MKLTYTYIRLDDGRRLIVPNERLAQSSVAEPHDPRPARAGGGVGVAAARRRPRQGDGADPRRAGRDRRVRGRGRQGGRAAERHHLGVEPRASAARRPPSCGGAGCVSCGSTHYPQPRPERGSPPNVPMTQRQRKSRRRKRHTGRSSVLLGLGRARHRRHHRRAVGGRLRARDSRDRARPLRAQAGRQGPALRRLRGRRLAARLHPVGRAAPRGPVARHPGEPPPRHRRHRGRALLQARRRRPQRDRPRRHQEPRVRQDRAGRLDDHPAARARALHQGPEARLRAQDPRGEARLRARGRALEDLDPRTTT